MDRIFNHSPAARAFLRSSEGLDNASSRSSSVGSNNADDGSHSVRSLGSNRLSSLSSASSQSSLFEEASGSQRRDALTTAVKNAENELTAKTKMLKALMLVISRSALEANQETRTRVEDNLNQLPPVFLEDAVDPADIEPAHDAFMTKLDTFFGDFLRFQQVENNQGELLEQMEENLHEYNETRDESAALALRLMLDQEPRPFNQEDQLLHDAEVTRLQNMQREANENGLSYEERVQQLLTAAGEHQDGLAEEFFDRLAEEFENRDFIDIPENESETYPNMARALRDLAAYREAADIVTQLVPFSTALHLEVDVLRDNLADLNAQLQAEINGSSLAPSDLQPAQANASEEQKTEIDDTLSEYSLGSWTNNSDRST